MASKIPEDVSSITALFIKSMNNGEDAVLNTLIRTKLSDPRFPLDVDLLFLLAAESGFHTILRELRLLDPRTGYQDDDGRRAIHLACQNGHLDCVRFILQTGAVLNCYDKHGRTPLHIACMMGFVEIVRLLVQQCANINSCRSELGECAVHITAALGNKDVMDILLAGGGNINIQANKLKGGETPLHKAVASQKADMVEYLCSRGAQLNVVDANGKYPIHVACEKGYLRCVGILICYGAKLEVTDGKGQTALGMATLENHTEISKLLIESGALVQKADVNGLCPLHKASLKGNLELMDHVLYAGGDVDVQMPGTLKTPLLLAVSVGKLDSIRKLIKFGADVTLADAKGCTPLHQVHIKFGGAPVDEVIKVLLEAGVPMETRDNNNFTPLQRGLSSGILRRNLSLPFVQLFCEAGAVLGPDVYTMGKHSLLFWLAYSGNIKVALYLVRAGWNLHEETWIHLPGKDEKQNKLHRFMVKSLKTTSSLLSLSRKVVRSHLVQVRRHREILSTIAVLPIPQTLKSFLALKDIDPDDMSLLEGC